MSDRARLRAVIEEVIATPTTDYVNTLVPPSVNERRRVEELTTRILDAIEPLIERKGPAEPIENFVPASVADIQSKLTEDAAFIAIHRDEIDALSDRIGDLETWRGTFKEKTMLEHAEIFRGLGGGPRVEDDTMERIRLRQRIEAEGFAFNSMEWIQLLNAILGGVGDVFGGVSQKRRADA